MTCTTESYVEMAKKGWSEDEIKLLKMEVQLARQKAKAESFSRGDTKYAQDQNMKKAETKAKKIAHDRFHAKLGSMHHEIKSLAKAHSILKSKV
jgi:hypothetical protein